MYIHGSGYGFIPFQFLYKWLEESEGGRGVVAQAAGKMAAWKPHEGRWPKPQAGLQLKPPAGCRPKSPAGQWEATERSCGARAGGDWTGELTMQASQRTGVASEDDAGDSSESRRACSRFRGQRVLLRGSQVSLFRCPKRYAVSDVLLTSTDSNCT
jgi:hypothetical protein